MGRSKDTFASILKTFKAKHPRLGKEISYWRPCGFAMIEIWFNDGKKGIYDEYKGLKFLPDSWIHEIGEKGGISKGKGRREINKEKHLDSSRKFAKNLLSIMDNYDITQSELARELCVSRQAISNYINARRIPDEDTMNRIADILEVDISELTKD